MCLYVLIVIVIVVVVVVVVIVTIISVSCTASFTLEDLMHRIQGVVLDCVEVRELQQDDVPVPCFSCLLLLLFCVQSSQLSCRLSMGPDRFEGPEIVGLKFCCSCTVNPPISQPPLRISPPLLEWASHCCTKVKQNCVENARGIEHWLQNDFYLPRRYFSPFIYDFMSKNSKFSPFSRVEKISPPVAFWRIYDILWNLQIIPSSNKPPSNNSPPSNTNVLHDPCAMYVTTYSTYMYVLHTSFTV